jgi:hypothetical protein
MRHLKNICKNVVGIPEEAIGRPRLRWDDNIKMDQ